MKVNRNQQFQAQFSGLRVGENFGPNLVVAESVFFTTEGNQVVATCFPVICTSVDAAALSTFISNLPTAAYADTTSARRAMPRVTTLSIGTLLRAYEKETETGVQTLRHSGTFTAAFRAALTGLLDANGQYTLANAQQALNTAMNGHTMVVPTRQCAVRTARGGWVAWLDFDLV